MTKIVNAILQFCGVDIHQMFVIVAFVIGAFFFGMAIANGWAADSVLKSAKEQVQVEQAKSDAKLKAVSEETQKLQAKAAMADKLSSALFAATNKNAELQSMYARAYIAKGQNNAQISSSTIIGDASLRMHLDSAAGYCNPANEAPDSGAVDGETRICASTSDLTLGDLEAGYINLGEVFQKVNGQLRALQANLNSQLAETEVAK